MPGLWYRETINEAGVTQLLGTWISLFLMLGGFVTKMKESE